MQQKLADLQVREHLQLVSCCMYSVVYGRDPDNGLVVQSTSVQMESIWRMQVVRENATKRDIWKRCYTLRAMLMLSTAADLSAIYAPSLLLCTGRSSKYRRKRIISEWH